MFILPSYEIIENILFSIVIFHKGSAAKICEMNTAYFCNNGLNFNKVQYNTVKKETEFWRCTKNACVSIYIPTTAL
jgi:hypothetical protein